MFKIDGLVESLKKPLASTELDGADRARSFLDVADPQLLADHLSTAHDVEVLRPSRRASPLHHGDEPIDEGEARIGWRVLRLTTFVAQPT